MDKLSEVTVVFAFSLALSFVIERFLEVLKALYDLIDSRFNLYSYWTKKTYRTRDKLERGLRVFEYVAPENAAPILARFTDMLVGSAGAFSGQVPILSSDLVRAVYVKLWSKVCGICAGVALAFAVPIDLFASTPVAGDLASDPNYVFNCILTGTAIGLGSGPLHKVITSLERAKEKRSAKGGKP